MIQRKQTLFLLVAFICYALCLFLPIATIASKVMGGDSLLYNLGVVSGDQGIVFSATCLPLFILLAVSAVLALVTIFLFKNRKLQANLCSITALFNVLWYADYALMLFGLVGLPEVDGNMTVRFAACLPLVSLILVMMARKGVVDDEKLVRAADRIR